MSETPDTLGDRLRGRLLPAVRAVCQHAHKRCADRSQGGGIEYIAACDLWCCVADASRYEHGARYIDPLDCSRSFRRVALAWEVGRGWTQRPCWGCAWDGVGDIDAHDCADWPLASSDDDDYDYDDLCRHGIYPAADCSNPGEPHGRRASDHGAVGDPGGSVADFKRFARWPIGHDIEPVGDRRVARGRRLRDARRLDDGGSELPGRPGLHATNVAQFRWWGVRSERGAGERIGSDDRGVAYRVAAMVRYALGRMSRVVGRP